MNDKNKNIQGSQNEGNDHIEKELLPEIEKAEKFKKAKAINEKLNGEKTEPKNSKISF